MSEEFEVRGVHEDRMDEEAERETQSMAGQLAVMTAILATVGAMFSYMAGSTQAEAALSKNDAAIKKTEASNQAKSGKQNLSALGMQLVEDARKPHFEGEVKRYEAEKAEIKLAAEKLEKEPADFDQKSEAQMHQHHRWAQATTALQIAIATAAIALLTKATLNNPTFCQVGELSWAVLRNVQLGGRGKPHLAANYLGSDLSSTLGAHCGRTHAMRRWRAR